jgi:hypothetical protein
MPHKRISDNTSVAFGLGLAGGRRFLRVMKTSLDHTKEAAPQEALTGIQAPGMSPSGPSVWTGRALQAESDDLEVIGLALLYPALERNVMFLAIMDIRARSISFTTRPRRP